ncbi:PLxRFG domain-containing protein, partial [bacterium]|nr:PLxRFG domain-containing protein [bacterium]
TVTFTNLLDAPTWVEAKSALGLSRNRSMADVVNAARDQGYDGVSFITTNGREYIVIPKEEAPSATTPTETVETKEAGAAAPAERTEVAEPAAETSRAKSIKRLADIAAEARKLESDKFTNFADSIDPELNKEDLEKYLADDKALEEAVKDFEETFDRIKSGAMALDLYPTPQRIAGGVVYVNDEEQAAQFRREGDAAIESDTVDFDKLLFAPTMNQAKVQLGLPESAKISSLIQTAKDKGYDGITFKTASGQQFIYIPSAPSPSKAISSAPVNERLSRVSNAVQAMTVVTQTGDELQKLLANRFKSVATNVPVVVLEKGDKLPPQIANNPVVRDSWDVANAMYVGPSFGQPTIYLRGASFGERQSVNNVDALHEAAHAALDKKLITAGNMAAAQGVVQGLEKDSLVQAYRELEETIMLAKQAYDQMVEDGSIDPEVLELGQTIDVFSNPREFAAYGTTNPAFVSFLKSVRTPAKYSSTGRDKTLFTKFVEAVRKLLGFAPNQFNALADLFDITDRIAATQVRPAQEIIALRGKGLKTAAQRAKQKAPSLTKKQPITQTVTAKPSVNQKRMAKMLGGKLYGSAEKIAPVSIKELFQNSFDAIKGAIDQGQLKSGKISIKIDENNRSISIIDDGLGMPSSVMGNEFLQIAGTVKETKRASGGLGVAKMLFLFENNELEVVSLRDGVLSRMVTSGEQLKDSMDDASVAPKIEITSDPKVVNQYKKTLFPQGHGTMVRVVVPETYIDESTGQTKEVPFDRFELKNSDALQHSPLFENIDVYVDIGYGEVPIKAGTNFPIDEYTVFSKVKFNWGEARIYIQKEEQKYMYGNNTYVLSNGLYQFGTTINDKPGYDGELIKRKFYIDVSPNENVKPEDPGYPFDLNRQRFSPIAQKDFDNIFNYITLTFAQAEYGKDAASFGSVQYIDSDGKLTTPEELKPEVPAAPTGLTLIKPTDKVEVKDGVMYVNNRQTPELTVDDLSKVKIDVDELKIPQDKIDSKRVMVHDNVTKTLSADELKASSIPRAEVISYEKDATGAIVSGKVPFTSLAREKFGARFDAYLKEVGDVFMQLREVLVMSDPSYADLEKEAIGVSFDIKYFGVSIRLPFSGSFLNPASTEFEDKGTPAQTAVAMIGTMIHELAHFKIRNHGGDFAKEMQRDITYLSTMPGFDLADVKNSFAKFLTKNMDIYQFLNKEFRSGNLESAGRRFQDASNEQVGDGRITESVESTGGRGEGRQGVPGGARQSAQGVESVSLPPGVSSQNAARRAERTQTEIDRDVTEALDKFEKSKNAEEIAKRAGLLYKLRNRENLFPALAAIWRGTNYNIRRQLVKLPTNDFLTEWGGNDIPRLVTVNTQLQQLSGMSQKLMGAAADLSREINNAFSEDPSLRPKLEKIAKVTTLAQVDPTSGNANPQITRMYEELGQKGQKVYRDIKTYYDDMADLYESLLDEQINEAPISPEAKQKLLATIKKMYETSDRLNPYFPLMREGSYWLAVYSGRRGQKEFYMLPSMGERDAVAAQIATERGYDLEDTSRIEMGNDIRTMRMASSDPSALLKSTFQIIDDANFTDLNTREEMKDAVYQLYLRTMPEQSFRKQFLERKGYAGFRTDLLRDFNESALRMAMQLARLKYAPKLRNTLSAARNSIEGRPELEPFISEVERRVNDTLNPRPPSAADTVASVVNKLSFIHYLSGASSALLQPLGIFQTGVPILGARHGYTQTAAELAKLMKVWDTFGVMRKTATGQSVLSPPSILNASGLTEDEKRAVQDLLARDVTQNTYARALFDYKNLPTEKYGTVPERGKHYANLLVAGLLHSTERISREIIYLASYRLSRKNGMSHQEAVNQAVQDTNDSLGNYGEYNRPMVMRSSGGKIALQFQMYPLHVTLYLLKNFKRMIPFLNKEGKKEAAKIFFGTLGTTWMLAGAAGLPAFSTMMGLIGLAWSMFDDDEKPKDVKDLSFELWFRTVFLPEQIGDVTIGGKKLSDIIERGPLNALSGLDLSSRTGLNDLWFRDVKETRTAREELLQLAIEKAGAGVNMVLSWADAYEAFKNGDYQKGVE